MTPTDFDAVLTTQAGFRFPVRPAGADDGATIKEFFNHVSKTDLRFRFLSGTPEVSPPQISMLTHPNHTTTESFLVFTEDGATMVATGMLACDDALDHGEVAITIREDHKHKGIGWALLSPSRAGKITMRSSSSATWGSWLARTRETRRWCFSAARSIRASARPTTCGAD
jgi:hypothetical protein